MTEPAAAGIDWPSLSAMGAFFMILGSAITFIWTRGGRAALLQQQVATAEIALKAASERLDRSQAAHDTLLAQLHTHMESDASAFAELRSLAVQASQGTHAAEDRLTAAMEHLGQRIDSMGTRFDSAVSQMMGMVARLSGQQGNN